MRRCETCGGPGPCLWADDGPNSGRYCCARCHPLPGDEFFQRGKCDDCADAATRRFWQSGGALGQLTEHAAERKGYTMRLCERHAAGVEPAVWTLSGNQPEPARSGVYTVCGYCGQVGAACDRQHP